MFWTKCENVQALEEHLRYNLQRSTRIQYIHMQLRSRFHCAALS